MRGCMSMIYAIVFAVDLQSLCVRAIVNQDMSFFTHAN